MRKVGIIVGNPRIAADREAMRENVSSLLVEHPDAQLTWLQSSASYSDENEQGVTRDEHVLTCVAEWIEEQPKTTKKRRQR